MASFDDIYIHSQIFDDNEFFTQYYLEDYKLRYESNFFQLKFQPVLREFEIIEEIAEHFSKENNVPYLKFNWPQDSGLTPSIFSYIEKQGYEMGKLELYQLNPQDFNGRNQPFPYTIRTIDREYLENFIQFNSQFSTQYGEDFVQLEKRLFREQFKQENIEFLAAFDHKKIIGALNVISHEDYLEIDNVGVEPDYRKQGVASVLIQKVAEKAEATNKTVILVADGEETVIDMYQKLGFQYLAYKIHIINK